MQTGFGGRVPLAPEDARGSVDFEKLAGMKRAFVHAARRDHEPQRLRVYHRAEIPAGAEKPSALKKSTAGACQLDGEVFERVSLRALA